jgi:ubiquinone/menaquinone biosynthesis C-methylase UbiE
MPTKNTLPKYLHGYTKEEQNRLYEQARIVEQRIFDTVDFSECEHILELGCGVGAQTEILLRRFPDLHITALDASETQLAQAGRRLASYIDAGRVELVLGDAKKTQLRSQSVDAVFICWLLEHVPQPVDVLMEAHKVLKPNGEIVCNEVLNATFYLEPYSAAVQEYWFKFNDYQWNLGGDPFIGAKLGALLIDSGFHRIASSVKSFHYDKRFPRQRRRFIKFWTSLLLSATPSMLENKKVSASLVKQMVEELETAAKAEDSVIFYSWIQAHGYG